MSAKSPKKTPAKKKRNLGASVVFQSALVLVVILLVNYLGFHYYHRWDFSRSQDFRLAMQTRQTLRALQGEVKIKVFFSPGTLSYEALIARDVRSLLREIDFSGKPKIKVEYVDPARNIQRAQELMTRHGLDPEENLLLIEYEGRTRVVPFRDMADFDFTPTAVGDPPRVEIFRGEQVLTSALIALLDPEDHTVYFLQGQGEPPIVGESPVSILLEHVARQNVKIQPINLAATRVVPEDASAVFILGPRFDIRDEELEALLQFWKNDGRLFVFFNPDAETPNLHRLVEQAGIIPEDTRVLRTLPLTFAIGILRDVTGIFLTKSDITTRLGGVNAFFPDPVQSLAEAEPPPEGIRLRPLIKAAEPYWGETDYITDETRGVEYDDGVDRGFPVYLAYSADSGGVQDDRVELQAGKMIVVGSSRFLLDDVIAGSTGDIANLDFVLSGLSWMLERTRLTGVAPKVPLEFRLALSNAQLASISFYTMVAIPGAAGLFGLFVWWRRRK